MPSFCLTEGQKIFYEQAPCRRMGRKTKYFRSIKCYIDNNNNIPMMRIAFYSLEIVLCFFLFLSDPCNKPMRRQGLLAAFYGEGRWVK